MSDVGSPREPASSWALAPSCVHAARAGTEGVPPQTHLFLLQNQPQNIHPEVMGREEGCGPSSSALRLLAHTKGDLQVPGGHAPHSPSSPACGPRCSGSSCCSPRCLGSSHGRGQRSQGGPPGCRRRRRSSALPCEEEEEEEKVFRCSNETL